MLFPFTNDQLTSIFGDDAAKGLMPSQDSEDYLQYIEKVLTVKQKEESCKAVRVQEVEEKKGRLSVSSSPAIQSQLNPVVWRDFLFWSGSWDPDSVYMLDGVVHGFRMVDKEVRIEQYCRSNYNSCWSVSAFEKMNRIIGEELIEGKLSISQNILKCVHSHYQGGGEGLDQ